MKNSPAACATLGIDLVRMKLSVYMISAGIAGLGGCLYAMEIGAVSADRFSLFESMSMLMLLVVAGAAYIAGGFTAGLLYAAVFVALRGTILELGDNIDALHGASVWLKQFTAILPALIGIGLGRNPKGFLHDEFTRFGRLVHEYRRVVVGGGALLVVIWLLARTDVISNWTFVILTGIVVSLLPRLTLRFGPLVAARGGTATAARTKQTPLEFVGLGRSFTTAEIERLDRGLGLPVEIDAASP